MTRFLGTVLEGSSCGRPPVRDASARLPPDASRRFGQLFVLRRGFAAGATSGTRGTHKQLRSHGFSEPELLCFLIRFIEVPHRGKVNRQPWV